MEGSSQSLVANATIADNHYLLTKNKCMNMIRKGSPYSHIQIVKQLKRSVINREEIRKKKDIIYEYGIYDHLEDLPEILEKIKEVRKNYKFSIDPNLPIDLICVEKREEEIKKGKQEKFSYYTIFLVVSTNDIPDSLENRIIFHRFYLSRIISSKRLEIILVTPDFTKKINKKFLQDNGVGFWKFVSKEEELKEVFPSLSQRDLMTKEFNKSKPENIPLFFDKYVHNAVNAIAGVRPEQFGKRYIDRKLMDKIFDLKKISYCEELFKVINEHLTEKGNEYEFASEVFSKLWKEYISIPYINFLEIFEPSLQHVFAETRVKSGRIYRDHYLHQFQVFLLGLYIIDKLYDNFAEKYKNPEISWLIISSFHDMAYPVQLHDEWSGKFFNKVFGVTKELGHLELKSSFVDKSFLCCLCYLITRLCSVLLKEEVKGNWLSEKNVLVNFFYKKITEAKNHCILSSISLLKMIQETKNLGKITIDGMKFKDALEDIFIPSALAIALHDKNVWQELNDKKKWQKFKEKVPLPFLRFEDDPLSFLLIFCDNIQEWGRPSKSKIYEKEERWKRFYLKDLKYDSETGFHITIWTPTGTKGEKFFIDKQNELREIQNFLKQPPDVKFAIRLQDKEGEGEDFTMRGSPS